MNIVRLLIGEIERAIADSYTIKGFDLITKKSIPLSEHLGRACTGIYKDTAERIMTVSMRNSTLFLTDSYALREVQLYLIEDSTFFIKEELVTVKFFGNNDHKDQLALLSEDGEAQYIFLKI
jgi:hypothetical protein